MDILGFNNFIGILTLAGMASIVLLMILPIIKDTSTNIRALYDFIERNSLLLAGIFATFAVIGSLVYSEYFLFTPCQLCWYQRIFIYPQVILLWIGYIRNDRNVALYSMILAGIGSIISLYHYIVQISGSSAFGCSADISGVSCSGRYAEIFGFISIPLMGIVTGLAIFFLAGMCYTARNVGKN